MAVLGETGYRLPCKGCCLSNDVNGSSLAALPAARFKQQEFLEPNQRVPEVGGYGQGYLAQFRQLAVLAGQLPSALG